MSKSLEESNKKLEAELRDARDNAELLEFRLLELEQRESRERSPGLVRKGDKGDAEEWMSTGDSGCSGSLISLNYDIVDDIVDTQTDFRVSGTTLDCYYYYHYCYLCCYLVLI